MKDPKYTKALYDQLSSKLELGTQEDFEKQIGTDDKFRQAIYDQASSELDLGDYKTFEGYVKKKESPSDYGLPSKEVFSQMFAGISKPEEVSNRPIDPINTEVTKIPDISLKSPDFKGYEEPPLTQIIGQTLSKDRIEMHKEEYKKETQNKISELNKQIEALPKDDLEMLPAMNFSGGLILPSRPVSEEKSRLLKEKDDLRMAVEDPSKLSYILGKGYNQSLFGLADAIMNGKRRAPEEWLSKYDAGTLTDATATALGFLIDAPFFGLGGKIGGVIGKAAAKPIIDRAITKGAEKLIKVGFEESLAKKMTLKAATKLSQSIAGMSSSGVALGSYGFVNSALSDWAQPDAEFDDIKWKNAFKRGGKDTLLGISVGGLGIGSSAIAEKARAIKNVAGRIGAQTGIATGGLTAESALFTYGGALLDGRAPKDVTGKEFLETISLLGILKGTHIAQKPKESVQSIYRSLKYDPKRPGQGEFEVELEPQEIESLNMAENDYKNVISTLAKDDVKLAEILKDENVPALLKQKILWGARGVAMNNVNLYADKIIQNGESIDLVNKEGTIVDRQQFSSKEEADQKTLEIGLQLEDNKMQMRSAMEDIDKVKIISNLKAKGTDVDKLLIALDKPVIERTPEESKMVGDYYSMIPKEKKSETAPKEEIATEEKLSIGDKAFSDKAEMFKHLEDVAVDKTTGELDKTWFDREIDAWPSPETVKAINEWTEAKKTEIKAKKEAEPETPIETGKVTVTKEFDKNGLIDEIRAYNNLSASQKKKNALQANTIRVNAQKLGYELKEGGDEWKIGVVKDGKFLAVRKDPAKVDKAKIEGQKLLSEHEPEFQQYVDDVLNTNPDLFGVMIGGLSNEQRAQAFRDIRAGKKTTASAVALSELERMYKEHGGIDVWNAEGQAKVVISREEIQAEKDDLIKRGRTELDKYSYQDADILLEKGLITKIEYDEITDYIRKTDQESRNAEEDFYADNAGDNKGSEEKGSEEVKTITDEKQPEEAVIQPDITTGKAEGNKLPGGTEAVQEPTIAKGKEKPISTAEPSKVEGIKFKDKTYTEVDQVLEALDRGDITFEESKPLREQVDKFEEGLKAEAKKTSDDIGTRIDKGAKNIEDQVKKDINDENSKLSVELLPPDIISRGNTALWKQLVKVRDGLANTIAGQLKKGVTSQNDAIRWSTKTLTNLYAGLLRTQADMFGTKGTIGKLEMQGTIKAYAPHKALDLLGEWRKVVNSDPEALKNVWAVLDPELATKAGEAPKTYGDLSLAEKNLYFTLKEWNTWVWSTNYANGLIPTESHLKFKGDFDATGYSDYIARMYDAYEEGTILSPEIQEFISRGNSAVTSKLNTDYMKMREETNEWKQEHAITDPAYLTAKRVMQTIQNTAVKQYMDMIVAEHPEYVVKLKKGEDVPKGFTKLGASYSWGPLRNKAVANHIVEDFTGFYYQNAITNTVYDALKIFDRNKINQFYKKYRTVYNPFVQTGNITGNVFFASINGINPFQFVKGMVDNRNLHTTNPALYDQLLKSGLIGDTAITGEMKPLDILNPSESALGKADDLATKAYVGSDNLAKISAYQIFRKQGLTHEQAVRRAYDSFQNYATVGKTWDIASKIPLIGPTFVKFQADLQRILVNSMLTAPLTTIGTLMAVKMLGNLSSALSGETEEEQALREGRKGVPRIPFVNIPLSFKVGKSEVNVARYLSPLYLYNRGDSEMELSELSKFMPIQFQSVEEGKIIPKPAFADATWGWLGSVIADKDFRGMSIADPKLTKYNDPNTPTDEKVFNVLNYIARSQIPFYKGTADIVNAATGQLDYYGRKRTWEQAILNQVIKIQQFDKPELKTYVERNLNYLTSKYASLATKMGDAQGVFYKTLKEAEDKQLSPEAQQRIYESASKLRDKSVGKSLKEQIPVYQEIERLTSVYKKWNPQDPFIQENFQNIESGKNQRFNVLSGIDLQKKYPKEYSLLKKNDMLKSPEIPKFYRGKALTEDEKKTYSNIYWSEYIRILDSKDLLTQEDIDVKKARIARREKADTEEGTKEITKLQDIAADAASKARKLAEKHFRTKQ